MAESWRESLTPDVSGNNSPPAVDDGDDSSAGDDNTYVSSRVVFAAILFSGLIANCALVVYIFRGQRRLGSRDPPQLNLLLVTTYAAANVVSCLANGIWLVYAAAVGQNSAAYTTLGCSFDAAAVQMIVVVHAVGLALMSVDRLLSVRSAGFAVEESGFTPRRAAFVIAIAWSCSIALSLALVVPNGVDVEGVSQRYLCTVDSEAAAGYVWTTTIIGYVLPIGVVLAMIIATATSAIQHRRKLAASRVYSTSVGSSTPAADTGPIPAIGGQRRDPATSLTIEVDAAKFVACLFAVWCLFVLPFPVLSLVRIGRTAADPSRPFTYAKHVDGVVAGLFVSYPVLLPAFVLIWRRNLCSRCVHRAARTCGADGVAAADESSGGRSPAETPQRCQRVGDVHPSYMAPNRPGSVEQGNSSGGGGGGRPVPVLFATPHGLHVRSSSAPNALPDSAAAADRQVKPGENGRDLDDSRKCDVFGSVSALRNEDPLNTSDYDSGEEGGGDAGRNGSRVERSIESRDPPPVADVDASSVADPAASKTAWLPLTETPNCASCGVGDQPSSGSTWYDDDDPEMPTDSRIDRLIDSGVGTLKKSDDGNANVEGPSQTAEVFPLGDVAPLAPAESVKAEGIVKQQKKKTKSEDGRSSRRVADAETSENSRKQVCSERQKSAKATPKTCESQNKRTAPSSTQPNRRDLPKIVVSGRVDSEDDTGTGSRQVTVHANTDPDISTAMATLDVRSDGEEGASRKTKAGGGRAQATGRPLPPISRRRRASSESCASTSNAPSKH